MKSFLNAWASERTKIFSLRATYIYLALLLLAYLLPWVVLLSWLDAPGVMDTAIVQSSTYLFALVSIIFVGNQMGAEESQGIPAYAFLTQRRRAHWLLARLLWSVLLLTVAYVVAQILCWLLVQFRSGITMEGFTFLGYFGSWLLIITYSLLAFMIAVALRSRVAAVGMPLAMVFVVETLIFAMGVTYKVFDFLWHLCPSRYLQQLYHGSTDWDAWDIVVPLIWIAGALAIAFVVNQRCDV